MLHVRTACDDAESEVACNDDSLNAQGPRSTIDLEAIGGTTYFVFVDTFGMGPGGDYRFGILDGACENVCAANDDCADGVCVEGACVQCAGDDDCAEGVCEENRCLECRDDDGCAEGVCEANRCLECRDDDGCAEGVCEGNACVECREHAECGDDARCHRGACVPAGGGTCEEPVVGGPGDYVGFTEAPAEPAFCGGIAGIECAAGQTCIDDPDDDCDPENGGADCGGICIDAAGSCGGGGAPESVHAIEFEEAGVVCITTTDSQYDTLLHVRTDCADAESEVACNDDNRPVTGSTASAVQFDAEANTTYYVFVDGFRDSSGPYALHVLPGECELLPQCEVDDDCFNGVCLEGQCVQCVDDAGCEGAFGGPVCVENACRECGEDADCAENEAGAFCVESACAACRENADCAGDEAGEFCFEGACAECAEAADCADDQLCADGACVAGEQGSCEALIVGGPGDYAGLTAGDNVHGASCGGGAASPESVYQITFGEAGVVCITTGGSAFDTVLHVRSDCADPESEIACNDDNRAVTRGTQSAINLEVEADTPYFIFVDGFGANNSGVYALSISPGECVPLPECAADDECFGDQVCVAEECVACREDAQCEGAFGGEFCIDNACRACAEDAHCDEGVCEAGACVECRDDDACEGVCEENGCRECREDADCPGEETCREGGICVGDAPAGTCEMPRAAGIGGFDGFTEGEGAVNGSCGGGIESPEHVFLLNLEAGGDVCLSTAGSAYDTVLYVRTDCGDLESEAACNDDNRPVAGGLQSAITLAAEAGVDYYIFVDGFTGFGGAPSSGAYQLEISEGACVEMMP